MTSFFFSPVRLDLIFLGAGSTVDSVDWKPVKCTINQSEDDYVT